MKLYLMRHGNYLIEDIRHKNPLSEKGKHEIGQIADFLKHRNIHIAHLLHSEKLRAQETAVIIAKGVTCEHGPEVRHGIKPSDDIDDFIESIAEWDEDVLVVGHLPFMGKLVGKLVAGDENKDPVVFLPGTLVCLEKIDRTRWMIQWIINPSLFS